MCLQLLIVYQLSQHTSEEPAAAADIVRHHHRRIPSHNETNTRQRNSKVQADGSFNEIPVYYKDETLEYSTIACVGDNFQSDAHMYRSCQFRHFCFDTEEKEFVIIQAPQERSWLSSLNSSSLYTTAVDTNISVSLGGVNLKWGEEPFEKLRWFPKVRQTPIAGYYQLPEDHVWIPYHSMAGFNAGHLVWDDFMPMYSLLSMFGLDRDRTPLLTRYVLKNRPMWATCDWNDDMKTKCKNLMPKFLPLMNVDPNTFSTTEDFRFQPTTAQRSKYVCASYGAAGIGMLNDHGKKTHGWQPRDYETTHNMGRGASLYNFRNYMLNNLRISTSPLALKPPFSILFSVNSSQSWVRNLSFEQQIEAAEKQFSSNETRIHAHVLKTLSLTKQVELTSKSAIFVTSAGGGAVTATFLPRGATLIIYYQHDGSRVHNTRTYGPARLDWDLFNHASYLKVHWLPVKDMNTLGGLEILTRLIRNELDAIERGG